MTTANETLGQEQKNKVDEISTEGLNSSAANLSRRLFVTRKEFPDICELYKKSRS